MVRLGIVGYGNLGKACEQIAVNDKDLDLVGIFTRRKPIDISSPYESNICSLCDIRDFKEKIDVLLLCVGSKNDLIDVALSLSDFNTVDCFDTHSKMCEYIQKLQSNAVDCDKLHFIGIGWDPGVFSLMRAYFTAILPFCRVDTFWGKGVSQGHSEAIRKIDGVLYAKQYTIPNEKALIAAREGKSVPLKDTDRHIRECYVVVKEGENQSENAKKRDEIKEKIVNMPDYFLGYETRVHFIDEYTFLREHSGLAHGGEVIACGDVVNNKCGFDFSLKTQSNPHLTASILIAYAKCNAIMNRNGQKGVKTVLDIPISCLLRGDWIDKVVRFI